MSSVTGATVIVSDKGCDQQRQQQQQQQQQEYENIININKVQCQGYYVQENGQWAEDNVRLESNPSPCRSMYQKTTTNEYEETLQFGQARSYENVRAIMPHYISNQADANGSEWVRSLYYEFPTLATRVGGIEHGNGSYSQCEDYDDDDDDDMMEQMECGDEEEVSAGTYPGGIGTRNCNNSGCSSGTGINISGNGNGGGGGIVTNVSNGNGSEIKEVEVFKQKTKSLKRKLRKWRKVARFALSEVCPSSNAIDLQTDMTPGVMKSVIHKYRQLKHVSEQQNSLIHTLVAQCETFKTDMHAKDELIRELLHNSNGIRVAFRSGSSLGDNLDDMDNNKNILEETAVSNNNNNNNNNHINNINNDNNDNNNNIIPTNATTKRFINNNDVALYSDLKEVSEHSEIQFGTANNIIPCIIPLHTKSSAETIEEEEEDVEEEEEEEEEKQEKVTPPMLKNAVYESKTSSITMKTKNKDTYNTSTYTHNIINPATNIINAINQANSSSTNTSPISPNFNFNNSKSCTPTGEFEVHVQHRRRIWWGIAAGVISGIVIGKYKHKKQSS